MTEGSATDNATEARPAGSTMIALVSAAACYLVLAILWRLIVPTHHPDDASYFYTHTLMPSLLWVIIVFIAVGGGIGWLTNRKWPVAFGLLLPLFLALAFEISRDPTSHNLFPFEILFGWLPAFLIAAAAAHVGGRMRSKTVR